jgi:hypothetical protein
MKKSTTQMRPFHGWAMIDSGASSCFIHKDFVKNYKIPTIKKKKPRKLKVIDGREISSGLVEYECTFQLQIGSHSEEVVCNVADIGKHSIVLGMSWLRIHNPTIEWSTKRIIFNSVYCSNTCLPVSNSVQANVSGTENHLEDVSEDLGGVKVFQPLEGIPREVGGVMDVPLEGIPTELHDYMEVFSEDKVTELPPHRPYDLEIVLLDENKQVKGPVYPLRPSDDEELRKILKEQLDKGLIRPSKSRYSSP